MDIWQILMTPFSWMLKQFCLLFNSYGVALILFTIVIKLILFPFQLKGKKGMIQMNILSSQQREIQARYPNNPNKQNEEIQKLYAQNGVNPMSGCLWSMVPMFILFPLYAIIRRPIKYMMWLTEEATVAVATALGWADFTTVGTNELILASWLNPDNLGQAAAAAGSDGLFLINFNFLGIDLSQIPNWQFWTWENVNWSMIGLFLLPILSAGLSLLSSFIMNKTNAMNRQQEQNMAAQNRIMLIMMPLMSLWIGFGLPAGMCIYWICNSVFTTVQELIAGKLLKKDYEEAQRKIEEQAAAAKLAEKERRRAAAERKAAALAENKGKKKNNVRGKKKEEEGPVLDKSASRVGMRQYARGRAYDPNRYPVTEYRDPNLKNKPREEEPAELTEEEKALLAESQEAENTAPEQAEIPAPEASVEKTAEEAPVEEKANTPSYEKPVYDKPDYDGK